MGDERTVNGETNGEPIAGPAAPEESVEALRAEVARLTQEADRNRQQFLRAAADLENYRKQAARQREEAVASTRRALLAVILGVADTLERALAHAGGAGAGATGAGATGSGGGSAEAAAIADGIRLAHRQVIDVLSRMGVRPMEALGREFDPRFHDAVEAVAAGGCASAGTVAAEIQRGYMLGDEVLRPARVRVAQ